MPVSSVSRRPRPNGNGGASRYCSLGFLSLALLYPLGYVIAALALGRSVVKEPTSVYLSFLIGLGVLRLVGLLPVVGGLVTFLASAFGLGALAIADGGPLDVCPRRSSPAPSVRTVDR